MRSGVRPIVEAGAASAGRPLTAGEVRRLELYVDLVVEWSGRLSLTGVRSRDDVARVLVTQGFEVLPLLPQAGVFADLGSGAGVPGLLAAVCRPLAHVALVEASRKKAGFLQIAVRVLGLGNTDVVCARAERLGQEPAHRERYDVVTARSVADLRVLAEYALPLLRVGGVAVFPKGAGAVREVEAAGRALAILGGAVEIHGTSSSRSVLLVVRKTASTPPAYPRRPGAPARRPLG